MTYRVFVHYHLKKDKEHQALKFIHDEIAKSAHHQGCTQLEMLQSEKNQSHYIGTGVWHDLKEVQKFQTTWDSKIKKLSEFCTETPYREIYKITQTQENSQKVA